MTEEFGEQDNLPDHEGDLIHALKNQGGTPPPPPTSHAPLPPAAQTIPHQPPKDWPAFDLSNPKTDFQLQQALKLVDVMGPASTTSLSGTSH